MDTFNNRFDYKCDWIDERSVRNKKEYQHSYLLYFYFHMVFWNPVLLSLQCSKQMIFENDI